MSWGEAVRLAGVLTADPTSLVGSRLAGFEQPFSMEYRAMHAIAENFVLTKTKTRGARLSILPDGPWLPKKRRIGSGTSLSIADFRALWDAPE